MKTVDDCVAKLKRLDAKGRLWPQDMILEAQRGYLVLSDIETKVGHYTLHTSATKTSVRSGSDFGKFGLARSQFILKVLDGSDFVLMGHSLVKTGNLGRRVEPKI